MEVDAEMIRRTQATLRAQMGAQSLAELGTEYADRGQRIYWVRTGRDGCTLVVNVDERAPANRKQALVAVGTGQSLEASATIHTTRANLEPLFPSLAEQRLGRLHTEEEKAEIKRQSMARMAGWALESARKDWAEATENMARSLRRAADDLERDAGRAERDAGAPDDGMRVGALERAGWIVNSLIWVLPNMHVENLQGIGARLDRALADAKTYGIIEPTAE